MLKSNLVLIMSRGENRKAVYPEKTTRSKKGPNNKPNPHLTSGNSRIEQGHIKEASALIPFPP